MTSLPEAGVERPYGDPPKLDAKPDYKVAFKRAAAKFSQDQCTDLAASLTYYSVQAMFPAIIAAVSTIGLFGNGQKTTDSVIEAIAKIVGKNKDDIPEGFTTFINNLQGGGAGLAFILGILLSLWSASGYVNAFSRMSNRIYDVAEGRPVFKLRPWLYFVTIVAFVLAILAAFSLVVSGGIAEQIFDSVGLGTQAATVWDWAKVPFVIVVVIFIISLLFWGTPNVKRPFKQAMFNPGAVLAFVIWAIGTIAFAWYVSNMGNYGKTYGPMATPIILLLWLWITNLAMLFGAEFDSETLRTRQLKTGYPAEELILLPVRDEKGIDKKAEKYDALVEQAHALRLSSGVPDEAVRTMLPEAPKERSDERTMAAQAGSSEKRPTRPQSKTQEAAPALAAATKDEAPDLADGSGASRADGVTRRPATDDAAQREAAEIAEAREVRRRRALAESRHKREERERRDAQRHKVEAEQKKAEAERAKERKKAEAERPLEEKWAEVENARNRYEHPNTREYRAVTAEREERRRRWFSNTTAN